MNNRVLFLDYLRGIAAVSVLIFHLTMDLTRDHYLFWIGSTGVDLFFIISGFAISISLERKPTPIQFIKNRFARLYPTYWFVCLLTFLVIIILSLINLTIKAHHLKWDILLGNLTMVQYLFKIPDLDEPFWTLFIEMQFYWMVLFLIITNGVRHLTSFLLACTLLTALILLVLPQLSNQYISNQLESITNAILFYLPITPFLPLFTAGTIFKRLHENKSIDTKSLIILLILLIIQICHYKSAGRSHFFISQLTYASIVISYFVIFTIISSRKKNIPYIPILAFLGSISYSLYLIHHIIGKRLLQKILIKKWNWPFWETSFLLILPITIAVGYLTYRYIETPLTRKAKSLMKG